MFLPSIAVGGAAKTLLAVTVSLHPANAHPASRYVTVHSGNSLSSISQQVLGHANEWPALWWANRHAVPHPSELRVGQRIQVSGLPKVTPQMTRAALGADPAPAPAPVSTGTEAQAAPAVTYSYSGSGGFQSCVIARESGGNAGAVNPYSGAGGLYGFLPSTWHALGYSGLPEDASVSEQNAAYAKEYAQSGGGAWSAYDGC